MKKCYSCKEYKSLDSFHKSCNKCKTCRKRDHKPDSEEQKARERKRYHETKHLRTPEQIAKIKDQRREYRQRTRLHRNEYERNRLAKNIQAKLAKNLRGRFESAFKQNHKNGSAVKDLGCSIEFFKEYIENLFQPGMTWENYGKHGWHIDHIISLSAVDLTDYEEVKRVCHYTNLRPLWALENLKKWKN